MEKFLESLIYLLYPELEAGVSKVNYVKNLGKEFAKLKHVIGERLSFNWRDYSYFD